MGTAYIIAPANIIYKINVGFNWQDLIHLFFFSILHETFDARQV